MHDHALKTRLRAAGRGGSVCATRRTRPKAGKGNALSRRAANRAARRFYRLVAKRGEE
jgi:hypothetical protein